MPLIARSATSGAAPNGAHQTHYPTEASGHGAVMSSDNKGPDDPTIPPLKTGRARMKELAVEAAAERAPLEAELRAGLGREATPIDKLAIETIAATAVRARRLRADGRNDAEERQLLTQLLRATGLRPAPAAPAAAPSLQAQLAARGYTPPSSDNDDEADVVDDTDNVETTATAGLLEDAR